jgi:hypothetical protein
MGDGEENKGLAPKGIRGRVPPMVGLVWRWGAASESAHQRNSDNRTPRWHPECHGSWAVAFSLAVQSATTRLGRTCKAALGLNVFGPKCAFIFTSRDLFSIIQ